MGFGRGFQNFLVREYPARNALRTILTPPFGKNALAKTKIHNFHPCCVRRGKMFEEPRIRLARLWAYSHGEMDSSPIIHALDLGGGGGANFG